MLQRASSPVLHSNFPMLSQALLPTMGLRSKGLQAFHQHLQSLFTHTRHCTHTVPSVPPAASPLMSAATRPPARAGKLTDSDLYLYVRRCIADTTDEASTPCLYRQGVAKLPIVANIKNQEKRSARRRGAWTSLILPRNVLFHRRERTRESTVDIHGMCVHAIFRGRAQVQYACSVARFLLERGIFFMLPHKFMCEFIICAHRCVNDLCRQHPCV